MKCRSLLAREREKKLKMIYLYIMFVLEQTIAVNISLSIFRNTENRTNKSDEPKKR